MEFCNHFLAQSLDRLPDTTVTVACNTMPEVAKNFPYSYKIHRSKSFSILTPFLNQKNIEKMICKEKINILHGSMLHGGGFKAVNAGKKYGLPVVVQSHGSDVQCVPEIGYGARLRPDLERKIRHVLHHSNKVIAVSNMNQEMILAMGAKADKVTMVPNGVQYDEIGYIPYADMRSKFGLKLGDFVLITAGRNRPIKRMELLYRALAMVKQDAPAIKCVSVGPQEDLAEIAKTYRVQHAVILPGPIPKEYSGNFLSSPFMDLINLYRAGNLFVSVSYIEAFNMSALEAMACGTPVLVGKKQGIRDFIQEGETGFILKEESAENLAEMLVVLSKKRRELEKRREDIRNSVSHLTWDNTAKRLRDIYLSLLQ